MQSEKKRFLNFFLHQFILAIVGGISFADADVSWSCFPIPIRIIFTTYLSASTVLVSYLGWLISITLEVMSRQIIHQDVRIIASFQLLEKWQQCHQCLVELINEINNLFGFIQLILVTFSFIWMVNGPYAILIQIRDFGLNSNIIINALLLIGPFLCFFVIVYVPHRIKQQVCFCKMFITG